MSMLAKYIDDLKKEFRGYQISTLTGDLLSGLTVSAVALPLALAFGVSSGATAAAGLITAIFAGIVFGLLSGSSFQISGPTGAMSAILISVVAKYGIEGMFVATLMAGIILMISGIFKMGKLVSIIPLPVITGFTSGIAVIIALGQVDNFFGTTSQGSSTLEKLLSYWQLGFHPHLENVVFGLIVIVIMIIWPKKLQKYFPSSLLAIIIILILNTFLSFDVPTIGDIPRTLLPESRLKFSGLSFKSFSELWLPAISIAALGMIESLLCGASGARMKGEPLDANRELVAQGIGNLLLPFFGGVPATAAIARTSVAIRSGQKTRLTSVFHALGLLLSMFLLSDMMSQIPMAALAGVLMMTAWRMNEWNVIKYITGHQMKSSMTAFFVTLLGTVIFDLSIAIIAGLTISSLLFIIKTSDDLEITICNFEPNRFHGNKESLLNEQNKNLQVVYVSGTIFFGNVDRLSAKLNHIEDTCTTLIFSLRGLSSIDSTVTYYLIDFCKKCKEKGTNIYFTGVQKSTMEAFRDGGITKIIDPDHFYWSTHDVLTLLSEQYTPIGCSK